MQKHLSAPMFALLLGAMVTLLPAQSGTVSTAQPWIVFSGNPLEDSVRNAANQLPLFEWTEDSSRNQPLSRVAYRIWGYADWQMSRCDFPARFIPDSAVSQPLARRMKPLFALVYRYALARQDTTLSFYGALGMARVYMELEDEQNYRVWSEFSNTWQERYILTVQTELDSSALQTAISDAYLVADSFRYTYYKQNKLPIEKINAIKGMNDAMVVGLIAATHFATHGADLGKMIACNKAGQSMMIQNGFIYGKYYLLMVESYLLLQLNSLSDSSISLINQNIINEIPDALDLRLHFYANFIEYNLNEEKVKNNLIEKIDSVLNDNKTISMEAISAYMSISQIYHNSKNIEKSIFYAERAIEFATEIDTIVSDTFNYDNFTIKLSSLNNSYISLSKSLTLKGYYKEATNYAIKAINLTKKIENLIENNTPKGEIKLAKELLSQQIFENYANLHNIYNSQNMNYKSLYISLHLLNLYESKYDSILANKYPALCSYLASSYIKLYKNNSIFLDSSIYWSKLIINNKLSHIAHINNACIYAGRAYTLKSMPDSAWYYLNWAITTADKIGDYASEASYLLSLADFYLSAAVNRPDSALLALQRARQWEQLLPQSNRVAALRYYTLRGQTYTALADTAAALRAYRQGLDLYQTTIAYTTYQDREIWAGQLQDLHTRLLSLYVDLKDAKGAFYVAEIMKGRILQTALEIAPLEDELLRKHHPEWLEQRKMLRAKYYNLSLTEPTGTEIHTTRAALDSLQSEIVDALPALAQYAPMPDSLPQIQASLASDESVVEYFTDRDYLYAIVIPSAQATTPVLLKLCPVATVQTYMQAYTRHIRQYSSGQLHDSSYRVLSALYACLWQPLMPYPSDRVLLVPDPLLAGLSFGALLPPGLPVKGVNFLNNENIYKNFVINSKNLSYFQSAQGIRLRRKEVNASASLTRALVVFCDGKETHVNAMRADQSARLTFGRQEAKQVYSSFSKKGMKVDSLFNSAVTRGSLLKYLQKTDSAYDIIWLVAHGTYDSILNQSYIYGFNDTISEIDILQNMHSSQTRLVVLSACQSGLGKTQPGEGVAGIANAFLRTGTKHVAAGLWDLHDAASLNLMNQFLKNIQTGSSFSIEEAQRKYLQLDVSEGFKHPVYWAGYVIYQ